MVALDAIQVCTGKETRGRNEEIGGGGGICNAFKGMLVLAVVVRQLAEGGVEAKGFAEKEREKETTETIRERMAGQLVLKVSDATMEAWGRLDRGQVLVRSLAINGHCVIKSLGGKNLCEYSKKRAGAIWLFLRRDARSLGMAGRASLREQFAQKWYRSVRDFEPLEYIHELPQPSVFQRDHHQMWLRAYPVETPSPIAEADLNEVLFIDGLFHCRGGRSPQPFDIQPQLQMQPTMVQPAMTPTDIMNLAMQQFQMMCQQSSNCPNLTVYRQPAGRPMRRR